MLDVLSDHPHPAPLTSREREVCLAFYGTIKSIAAPHACVAICATAGEALQAQTAHASIRKPLCRATIVI